MSGGQTSRPEKSGAKRPGPKCQGAKRPGPKCQSEMSSSKKSGVKRPGPKCQEVKCHQGPGIFLPICPGPIFLKLPFPMQKKYIFFPNFDEKIPNMRGKFPKSDKVSL